MQLRLLCVLQGVKWREDEISLDAYGWYTDNMSWHKKDWLAKISFEQWVRNEGPWNCKKNHRDGNNQK